MNRILKRTIIVVGIIVFIVAFFFARVGLSMKYAYPLNESQGKGFITEKELNEDLKQLKLILSNGYIIWNEQKVDFSLLKKAVKEDYKKEKQFDGTYSREKFSTCIANTLVNTLNQPDGYMAVGVNGKYVFPYHHYSYYFSDVYLKKVGEDFEIFKTTIPDITAGMKFTGNTNNLCRDFSFNDDIYRYTVFSNKRLQNASISVEGNNFQIPVYHSRKIEKSPYMMQLNQTENSVYITITDFAFPTSSLQVSFKSFLQKVENTNMKGKNIILDLRDFNTGNDIYVEDFISSLIAGEDSQKKYAMMKLLYEVGREGKELNSPLTSQAVYWGTKNTEFNKAAEGDYLKQIFFPQKKIVLNKNPSLQRKIEDLISDCDFDSKIYILTDASLMAAGEQCVAFLTSLMPKQVILIGENSYGAADYTASCKYNLRNSGISLYIPFRNSSGSFLNTENQKWQGDTKGFIPDYVVPSDGILNAVKIICKDPELSF